MWKSATVFNSQLYITGGVTVKTAFTRLIGAGHTGCHPLALDQPTDRCSCSYLRTAQALDLRTRQWSDAAEAPSGRSQHGAVAFGTQLWLIGGTIGNSGLPGVNGPAYSQLDTVDVFDRETGSWSTGPPLQRPATISSCAVVEDTLLVLLGGNKGEVQRYDPLAGCWADGPSMPREGFWHWVVLDQKLYAVTKDSDEINEYHPTDNAWHIGTHPRLVPRLDGMLDGSPQPSALDDLWSLETSEGSAGLKAFDLEYTETASLLWLEAFELYQAHELAQPTANDGEPQGSRGEGLPHAARRRSRPSRRLVAR